MLYLLLLLQPIKDAPDPVIRSAPGEHHYRWVYSNKYADQVHLFDNGAQVGIYVYSTETYYTFNVATEKWALGKLPTGVPAPPIRSEPEVAHNYRWVHGADPDQVHLFDGPVGAGEQVGTWIYSTHTWYLCFVNKETGEMSWQYPHKRLPEGVPPVPAKLKTYPAPLPIPERC